MRRTKSIDRQDIIAAENYVSKLDSIILEKSESYNLLNQHITGYGRGLNLSALCDNGIIDISLYEQLNQSLDFIEKLNEGDEILVNDWNDFVAQQQDVIQKLNFI